MIVDDCVEVEEDMFGKKGSMEEFEQLRNALKRNDRFSDGENNRSEGADVANPGSDTPITVTPLPPQAAQASNPAPSGERTSIISIGSTWQGTLKIEGSVRVEGQLSGEIEARDTVCVAEGAEVNAKVRAAFVSIAGRFQGQVHCSERLEILPTGRVNAELMTKSFVVHEGAVLEGQVQMTDGKRPAASAEPPKPGDGAKPAPATPANGTPAKEPIKTG
ncbi:MAG TPA: polymer-forming cytoskeletal protein [Chloroflexota bacterium]|nr:polymer-forming cytoskeletal protein [Chloroflexota bacterium]